MKFLSTNSRFLSASGSYCSLLFSCSDMSDSFATPWTAACQIPLTTELSRQEYWSELPLSTLGDLFNPGIEPVSLESPALASGFFIFIFFTPLWHLGSPTYVIRELQIKITVRCHYTPIRMAKMQNTDNQMLVRMWSNRNFHSLLVGMKTNIDT